MRSYAATETQVLTKLRMPASIPYVFTALKISATASVIGAIIGELPAGLGDGLGRSLLTFSYYLHQRSGKALRRDHRVGASWHHLRQPGGDRGGGWS